jgi:hypothetical protein
MTTEIGQDFKTQIPSLSDDANIQEAFRLYHYGISTEPDQGTPISPLSIESHLKTLSSNIDAISAGQAAITVLDQENLNSVVETGTYHKPTTPVAGYGYPSLNPGLLSVTTTSSGSIYQAYQTIGGASGTNNRWWRGRTSNVSDWSAWKQASFAGHTHDDRYYTETELDAKLSSSMTANSVAVTDASGKVISSTIVSTTELGMLDGAASNIQDQLNDRYTKSESTRIFVQQTTPSIPQAGDIWIW